jgi:hypothetical protein
MRCHGAEARLFLGMLDAALKRRSSTMLHAADCDATEAVPFLVVALPKSQEGHVRGIPPFGFAQGRLRKVREGWGTLGSSWLVGPLILCRSWPWCLLARVGLSGKQSGRVEGRPGKIHRLAWGDEVWLRLHIAGCPAGIGHVGESRGRSGAA